VLIESGPRGAVPHTRHQLTGARPGGDQVVPRVSQIVGVDVAGDARLLTRLDPVVPKVAPPELATLGS
jgi:hypothetical protein